MKTLLLILFFIPLVGLSQVRGVIVSGAEWGAHALENPKLKRIAEIQKEIALYQSAIAVEQAAIVKLEDDLYKGVSKKEKFIEGLKIIIKIAEAQQSITDWLKETETLISDTPDLTNAFKKKELLVLLKTTVFVTDIIVATKEDKSNLMNNKQRYEILNTILKNIEIVEGEVKSLYFFFKQITTLSKLEYEPSITDYTSVLTKLESDHARIFPETLKE